MHVHVLYMYIEFPANSVGMLPLYEGARINTETSWSAIMKYAITHKLSYSALGNLIDLVKVNIRHACMHM